MKLQRLAVRYDPYRGRWASKGLKNCLWFLIKAETSKFEKKKSFLYKTVFLNMFFY